MGMQCIVHIQEMAITVHMKLSVLNNTDLPRAFDSMRIDSHMVAAGPYLPF
jgi:hypothetical protein